MFHLSKICTVATYVLCIYPVVLPIAIYNGYIRSYGSQKIELNIVENFGSYKILQRSQLLYMYLACQY